MIVFEVIYPNPVYKLKPYSKKEIFKNKFDSALFTDYKEAYDFAIARGVIPMSRVVFEPSRKS